jgi:YD repeat-containing protein
MDTRPRSTRGAVLVFWLVGSAGCHATSDGCYMDVTVLATGIEPDGLPVDREAVGSCWTVATTDHESVAIEAHHGRTLNKIEATLTAGRVSAVQAFDEFGDLSRQEAWNCPSDGECTRAIRDVFGRPTNMPCRSYRIRWVGDTRTDTCLGVDGAARPDFSGITTYWSRLGREGPLARLTLDELYLDGAGRPTAGEQGYSREMYEREEVHGCVTRSALLTAQGLPAADSVGISVRVFGVDGACHDLEETRFDAAGTPGADADGVHRVVGTVTHGDFSDVHTFEVDGAPHADAVGRHETRYGHDGQGRTTSSASFGIDGKPLLESPRIETAYDASGRASASRRSPAVPGQAVDPDTHFQTRWVRDAHNCVLEERRFDVAGAPSVDKRGIHLTRHVPADSECNDSEVAYFGTRDEPVNDGSGVHRIVRVVSAGLVYEERRFDAAGAPVAATGDHAAIVRSSYDELGHLTSRSWWGVDDKPTRNREQYHRVAYTWTGDGQLASQAFFDRDGSAANGPEHAHRVTYTWNAFNHVASEAYFGKNDQPTNESEPNRVHLTRFAYDDHGVEAEESYWKDERTPGVRWDGTHAYRETHNERGELLERSSYDVTGELKATRAGFSREVWEFDPRWRRATSRSYFHGQKPVPIVSTIVSDYHRLEFHFDDQGELVDVIYLGTSREPVEAQFHFKRKFSGHRVVFERKQGRVLTESVYAVGGTVPTLTLDCQREQCVGMSGIDATEVL